MDDDYDNYVPQISTMDWQNLGGGEGGQLSAAGQDGQPFLYEGSAGQPMGQQMGGGGQQYQQSGQRGSFPGMSIPSGSQQGQPFSDYAQMSGAQTQVCVKKFSNLNFL